MASSSSPPSSQPALTLRPTREAVTRLRFRFLRLPRISLSSFVLLLRPPRRADEGSNPRHSSGGPVMELIHKRLGLVALVALAGLFLAGGAKAIAADEKHIEFDMVRSATA